jgi:flavin-dependent dehydrogenase
MPASPLPEKVTVLVVGGGPSGSYAGGLLAREGHDVLLLESAKVPRYHIGESLLPSILPHLRFFGAYDKIKEVGFVVKPGAGAKFNTKLDVAYTDQGEHKSWNVERAHFDEILYKHAGSLGVKLQDECAVTELEFENGDVNGRPIAAKYRLKVNGENVEGRVAFDYLIDASGRAGIMSVKYLKNREMKASLKNIAFWGYWTGNHPWEQGTRRENAPYFETLQDGSGWGWAIPLRGKLSVGICMAEAIFIEKKKALGSLEAVYLDAVKEKFLPGFVPMMKDAVRIQEEPLRQASDYSYSCTKSSGDHWRAVGDAAFFIDPMFSSGVHLAMGGGLAGAVTVAASLRGDVSEAEAAEYHHKKCAIAYTRFLMVVLGIYRHVRNTEDYISEEDLKALSFQGAFDIIRPVIQGHADTRVGDVGRENLEFTHPEILRKTIDFCAEAWDKAFCRQNEIGDNKYTSSLKLAQTDATVTDNKSKLRELERLTEEEISAIHVIKRSQDDFISEDIGGLVTRMVEGELGLSRTGSVAS